MNIKIILLVLVGYVLSFILGITLFSRNKLFIIVDVLALCFIGYIIRSI